MLIIGVAGGTGSGKTTIVDQLIAALAPEEVTRIAHDNYYKDQSNKTMAERVVTNYDHPLSLETSLLVTHLQQLKAGKTVAMPVYDFVHHTRATETVSLHATKVVIVEGILTLEAAELRPLFDLKIFVDTDADLRFIRRMQRDIDERGRDVQSVIDQYLATVKEMHQEFVEPSKRYADVIIPENGENPAALDLLVGKVRHFISAS